MAGPSSRRLGNRKVIKTPSTDDDEALADAPLYDTMIEGADAEHYVDADEYQQDEVAPLGANVCEALNIVSQLEQLGLDKQDISLPKCIVLGDQSAGKSSVIEAISGIKTPRATGLCTRCPLYIVLQNSPGSSTNWHAEVHLLLEYDLATEPHHSGLDREFEGWVPAMTTSKIPFAETDDPKRLEHLIRCAQYAVLSPLEDPRSFLDPSFNRDSIHKTLFSPNNVCIVVSHPTLPPLSFYDLPGIIGQAESDDETFTVQLVEDLVKKYIVNTDSLILVTCPLEQDVATSSAAGLARRLQVADRCVGVLTKPDRLSERSDQALLAKILENRCFALGHSYFVVKNLDSEQIRQGLTHADARRLEQKFFSTIPPWSTELRAYQSRFGTLNLQRSLSYQLGHRMVEQLPAIRVQIEQRLAAVEADLDLIPDIPLHTAVRTVSDVVHAFAEEVRKEIAGEHGYMAWSNAWESIQKSMWDMLLKLKPTMMTLGQLDENLYHNTLPGRSADDYILIDSDNDTDMPKTPSKKRKHDVQPKRETQTPASAGSPQIRTPRKPASVTGRGRPSNTPSTPSSNQSDDLGKLRTVFRLDEVTRHVSMHSKSRVPGQINLKVREDLMLSALKHWQVAIDKFFDELEQKLQRHIRDLFEKHFGRWKDSDLHKESLEIVMSLLVNNLHEQRTTMASESLNDEFEGPHIFHKDLFMAEKLAITERYSQARSTARLNAYIKDCDAHRDHELTSADKEKIRKDGKQMALIREEPYLHEIDLVADVTTYYTIAARRFHDSITMRIESKFFKQLRTKLRDQLHDELGIDDVVQGPYKAQRLLAESPERLARRNGLLAKKKALEEGLRCFREQVQQYQANNGIGAAQGGPSNYQNPSVSSPQPVDMEDVRASQLPLRSGSRTMV